jgi:hypothetical protein
LAHQTFRSIIGKRLFNCCLGIYKAGPRLSFLHSFTLKKRLPISLGSLSFINHLFGFYILYDERSLLEVLLSFTLKEHVFRIFFSIYCHPNDFETNTLTIDSPFP